MLGYLLCSLDPGGSADPAGIVVMHVSRPDRMTKARVMHLQVKPPILTATAHIDLVQSVTTSVLSKVGLRAPIRYVVDISNNSAIAYLLAQALPNRSLIGVRVSGGDAHGAGLVPMMVGDVGGKATSIPVMSLSRRQLLLDVGVAFQSKQLSLPLDDPEQAKGVQTLREQMSRASLKVTPSGKQIAVVQRSNDDLLMSLAQGWAATKLPPPREAHTNERPRAPFSSAAWT